MLFFLGYKFAVEKATSFPASQSEKTPQKRGQNSTKNHALCLALVSKNDVIGAREWSKVVQKTPIIGVFQGFLTPITCKKDPQNH